MSSLSPHDSNLANKFSDCSAADIVDTTPTAVSAAVTSFNKYAETFVISNSDATVGTRVDILDGTTLKFSVVLGSLAAGQTTVTVNFPKGMLFEGAINATCGTTSALVRVAVAGYKVREGLV